MTHHERRPQAARSVPVLRPGPDAGFTMLEVLVTLAIMSLVMVALYSSLNATLRARDQLEIEARVARLGPTLLDLIEEDLSRAWLMDIDGDRVFLGESRTVDGEPADSLSFLTTVDSSVMRRVGDREESSDVCETGYRLRRNPALPDVMELWRRQSFHVDEEPLQDGEYELLYDRIVSFQVRYLERLDPQAEKLQEWDASKRHKLPAAVEIQLSLEAVPRTQTLADTNSSRIMSYRRLVPLGEDTDLRMRVHALPPTYATQGGGVGGAGMTGGKDGAEGDGSGTPGEGDLPTGNGDQSFQDFLNDLLGGSGGGGGGGGGGSGGGGGGAGGG